MTANARKLPGMTVPPPRPQALRPEFDRIPAILRDSPSWVLWRYTLNDKCDKWTKPPFSVNGGFAKTTDPATWCTFDGARAAYQRGGFDGIGVVLTDGIAGVDIDHAIDKHGEVADYAADALRQFKGTYRERSPSGKGFRIFARGVPLRCGKGGPDNHIEVYAKESPRYLTVTGHALDDVAEVTPMQSALDWLHATHMDRTGEPSGGNLGGLGLPAAFAPANGSLTDDEVIARARSASNGGKFVRLWAGDASDHGDDHSTADMALIGLLHFWTQDAGQLDRLFRQSRLMRPKWDEKHGEQTYGAMTIAKVLQRGGETYGNGTGRLTGSANGSDVPEAQPHAQNAAAGDPGRSMWPDALRPEAMHGIAGEFVRATEPRTESDPAALLVQFLVAFGALVGCGPHFYIDGAEHHCNLFALLVGDTSKGRKGTSWGRVREVYEHIAGWKPTVSGLSSGEGVKYHVRDAREETKTNKRGELVTEVVDAGEADKRLLVIESEFASALRASQREANTLSATVREAWDTGNLRTLTKRDPVTATGAHVCIVGHITADELRAELTATDTANGFANRFLFVATRRSKLLPRGGGEPDAEALQAFSGRLAGLAEAARRLARVTMTAEAWAVWDRVYPELSAAGDGLHGAVTARAEAQVLRLALVYCLLDGADRIEPAHLLAALAVWTYCDATAKHIFGASLGDRIADEIMRRLRVAGDAGMARNELRDAFGRNVPAERIGVALDLLRQRGRATCESVTTGGRPAEVWRAVK